MVGAEEVVGTGVGGVDDNDGSADDDVLRRPVRAGNPRTGKSLSLEK